jgi:hypothetical protein
MDPQRSHPTYWLDFGGFWEKPSAPNIRATPSHHDDIKLGYSDIELKRIDLEQQR